MRRHAFWIAAAAALLAGCAEKSQDMTESRRKADVAAWQGTGGAYTAPGWTAGDEASWEKQINTRAQGQNEYVRMSSGGAQ
jgi:hypothetical protein